MKELEKEYKFSEYDNWLLSKIKYGEILPIFSYGNSGEYYVYFIKGFNQFIFSNENEAKEFIEEHPEYQVYFDEKNNEKTNNELQIKELQKELENFWTPLWLIKLLNKKKLKKNE